MRKLMFCLVVLCATSAYAQAPRLETYTIPGAAQAGTYVATGTVQAVRWASLAVPVSGRITHLPAQVNQHVKAGQLLAQVDSTPADQTAQASRAQIAAAQASLTQAKQEWQRTQALAAQHYLSTAALEKAQAQYQVAAAQAQAQIAAANAAGAQAAQYRLQAPFAGIIARVDGNLGALAMPAQTLVDLYDPNALRVEVQLPASVFNELLQNQTPELRRGTTSLTPTQVQWFPTTEQYSQTRTVRIGLHTGSDVVPGSTVQVNFSTRQAARIRIPTASVLRQNEFASVYVVNAQAQSQLRYVRLGQTLGDHVEVLAGLRAGERIALQPELAAQHRQGDRP